MNKSSKGLFDPRTAFFSLPIVKWTIFVGLISIIIVCSLIIIYSSREFDLSAEGFNEFLIMMKVPTFLLGFFAALLALYATNHRSEQNKASMILAEAQNKFSNYYKHIEEYNNYLNNKFEGMLGESKPIIDIQKLHRCLYPNARSEGIQLSLNVKDRIFENIFNFIECLIKTNFQSKEEIEKLIIHTDDSYKHISDALMDSIILNISGTSVKSGFRSRQIQIPDARLRSFLNAYLTKIHLLNAILHFEETFNSAQLESLISHAKTATKHVPDISIGGSNNIEWHEKSDISMNREIEILNEKLVEFRETSVKLIQEIRRS